MEFRRFEYRGRFFVTIYQGGCIIPIEFLDMESQNAFVVALGNSADNFKEIT